MQAAARELRDDEAVHFERMALVDPPQRARVWPAVSRVEIRTDRAASPRDHMTDGRIFRTPVSAVVDVDCLGLSQASPAEVQGERNHLFVPIIAVLVLAG